MNVWLGPFCVALAVCLAPFFIFLGYLVGIGAFAHP